MRIGFIGAGKHAQCIHIPNYQLMPGVELACLVDIDAGLAAQVAKQFNIPKTYTTHTDMIKNEKLDAVVMVMGAIPTAEKMLIDLMDAKIPVITEKPIAGSVPSAERIVAHWKKTGSTLFVGYHKRCDPASMWAKSEIERFTGSGELGPMKYARVHISLAGDWIANGYSHAMKGTIVPPPDPRPESDFTGMSKEARQKFGPFAGAHSHQLDLMRYLLGAPYHVKYVDPTGVLLAVESEKGVPGVFEFSPYNSTKDWREQGLVCFEKGYVKVDLPAPLAMNLAGKAELFRDNGGTSIPASTMPVFPSKSAMFSVAECFLAALRGEKTPLCTPQEALEALIVARDWATKLHP
ncbi:MAG: Gfo/Idh/MocA family oxidoreductase [Spirochaetes bacterium]|nr:Gfo/Idh/MocA family oxidoreductase [Spirochaetota bacterium]